MMRSCFTAALLCTCISATHAAEPTKPWHEGHRVMFNGDCTFLFGEAFANDPKARYEKQTLHRFIDKLADSGVDTYLCNPNASVPWYPSKRTPTILNGYKRGDTEFFRGMYMNRPWLSKEQVESRIANDILFLNRYLDLAEAGVDWVAEISTACRRRGVSPWISIRMNDTHGANSWEKAYFNCALLRDPKYRLSGRQPNPRDGVKYIDQALDYAHPEVRDYMMLLIREAIEDHDIEGVELDWFRMVYCMNAPATQEQIDTMTKWHAEVRRLTQAKAKKLGRPCPLGVRVPVRLGQLREIGLDIKAMADAGIIDFVNVSNSWQTSWDVPYEELRHELGPRVAIYGVIEDAPNWMNALDPKTGKKGYRLLSASRELLRGNAASKLVMGVQGIETFNFFCTEEPDHSPEWNKHPAQYAALKELRDLEGLRGKPKQYSLSTAVGGYQFPRYEYAEQLPMMIEPDGKKAFRLTMCAEPSDAGLELVVQVVVDKTDAVPELGVSLNGSWPSFAGTATDRLVFPTGMYTHHVPEHRAFDFVLPASRVKDGWNEVLIFNGNHKNATPAERRDNTVRVVGLDLALRKH
jgi:hypothetical protein